MVKMTGRKALFESLKLQGVEYIFGNPGTSESPIMHELQFHPEFKSKPIAPHPLFRDFVKASIEFSRNNQQENRVHGARQPH